MKIFSRKPKEHIEFVCIHEAYTDQTIPHPVPAYKKMPAWFRKLKPDTDSGKSKPGTAKKCMPVLDAMSQGYIIPLWADLYVQVGYPVNCYNENGDMIGSIMYASDNLDTLIGRPIWFLNEDEEHKEPLPNEIITYAQRSGENLSIIMGISGDEISNHTEEQIKGCPALKLPLGRAIGKFSNPWIIKVPKGWSIQIKNPANSFETNIHCMEGVVDADEYHNNINLPFIWTGSEVGEFIIPKGTPLVQVIPFERKDLNVMVRNGDKSELKLQQMKLITKMRDRYRSLFWHGRKDDV